MNIRLVAVLAVVVLVVAGCGSKEKAEGAAGADTGVRAKQAAGAEAVAAVLQSTGTPVAKLGFVVVAAPVVGLQSALRLDISAAAPVPALLVSAEGDGVTIDPVGAQTSLAIEVDKVASHELKLTPQREGLAEITVRLRAGTDGAETTYVIPVLVAKAAGA